MSGKPTSAWLLSVCSIGLIGVLAVLSGAAIAAERLPGQACQTAPLLGWSKPEIWVWERVCEGEIADFNARNDNTIDPKSAEGWTKDRELSPAFLETILLHDPFRSALTRSGVRIVGAWFRQPVDIADATLDRQLWLDQSRFNSNVDLSGLKTAKMVSFEGSYFIDIVDLFDTIIGGQLNMDGSKFISKLNMQSVKIGGDLFMSDRAEFDEVSLIGATIAGLLQMTGSTFTAILDMNSVKVSGSLFMHSGAEFGKVDLVTAKIGGQLDLSGSTFAGKLNMDSIDVGGHLFMRDAAQFDDVVLRNAKIGDQFAVIRAKFSGKLDMESIEVGASLFMLGVPELSAVILSGAKIRDRLEMDGSKFTGMLDMASIEVGASLSMRGGAEFGEVILRGARIGDQLEMIGSKFTGELNMDAMDVGSNLFMQSGEFGKVSLDGAQIGGRLSMNGSKFTGELNMDSAEIGQSLLMDDGAQFSKVDLRHATIDNVLSMSNSSFTGNLILNSTTVGGHLFMRREFQHDNANFGEVDLRGAKIGGRLEMDRSRFTGKLFMQSLEVSNNLWMRDAAFGQPVSLIFATIGANLDLSGAEFGSDTEFDAVDLTGTKVTGELRLGLGQSGATTWEGNARLTLRNTVVNAVNDHQAGWPKVLELEGFTYSQLGGFGAAGGENIATRETSWFIDWLARDESYSPQPYEQLSSIFKNAGQLGKANDILFVGRERERASATGSRWVGLTFLKYVIGYGYGGRYFYSLAWIYTLVVIGAFVLRVTGEHRRNDIHLGFAYSLDMLLPIIQLRDRHYESDMDLESAAARYYFYVHKMMGYVLASFLVAGLSGLTQ